MRNIHDIIAKFDNSIFKKIHGRLINREGLVTEIGRLFYASFVFLPRVQSGALPTTRASSEDRVPDTSHAIYKSLMCIIDIANEDRLIRKLRMREI